MKFARDYIAENPELNRQDLIELQEQAEHMKLPGCPFCGGEAVLKLSICYRIYLTLSVACASCRCETGKISTGQVVTGENITLHDALIRAAAAWSRRA